MSLPWKIGQNPEGKPYKPSFKPGLHLGAAIQNMICYYMYISLGGGFKYVLCSSLLGEDVQFDYYFSNGLKPPTRSVYIVYYIHNTPP